MWTHDERPWLIAIVSLPAIVGIGLLVLFCLPIEALEILTVWALASFPIGVLTGHCVLSEE